MKKRELLLGRSVIFSSKEVPLVKHEHKPAFISRCSATANITNKPSQGRESNPALPALNTAKTRFWCVCDPTAQPILQKQVREKTQTSCSAVWKYS